MFAIDGLSTTQYARVDEYGAFELPLLFRAALALDRHSGVCLALEGGELRLAHPGDQPVLPGMEWAEVDVQGYVKLPEPFRARLDLQENEYLVLTLDRAERRVSARPKPEGCILCPETDSDRFTISDLLCDGCMARFEEELRRGNPGSL